ncbi:MAG: tRNA lysidine(34) synthetase TilS [Hyphomicrobiaceae bacterium]
MPDAPLSDEEVDALFRPLCRYQALVLAVSGGADSTAMMHAAAAWRDRLAAPPKLLVVTIDHGLREEAAAEAATVAAQAKALGLEHRTLSWTGPKPPTGIQAAARTARYSLLLNAACQMGAAAIVTAHTADDQAETVLMRLARGSGVDGLAGIPAVGQVVQRDASGEPRAYPVHRPFLGISRRRLLATLAATGSAYSDDPSNQDPRFERVRVRDALVHLQALGVTRETIARAATRLQTAKAALDHATDALWRAAVTEPHGLMLVIDQQAVAAAPDEIGLRLLRRALARAGGAAKPADLAAIEHAYQRLIRTAGGGPSAFTLGGAIVEACPSQNGAPGTWIRLYREPDREGSPAAISLPPGGAAVWDARFWVEIDPEFPAPVEVGPLGAHWASLAGLHNSFAQLAIPAGAARAVPAFRMRGAVIAVPALAEVAQTRGDATLAAALDGPRQTLPDGTFGAPQLRSRRLVDGWPAGTGNADLPIVVGSEENSEP